MQQEKNGSKFTTGQVKLHLADSSRALAHLTANMVYDEPELFGVLVDVSLEDEDKYAQRASRVVGICSSRIPELFQPHCSRVIRKLKVTRSE